MGLQEHKKQINIELRTSTQVNPTLLFHIKINHLKNQSFESNPTLLFNIKINHLNQSFACHHLKEKMTGELNALHNFQTNHTTQLKGVLSASLSQQAANDS